LKVTRHAVWTRVMHRSGLERPHFSPLARGEKTAGVAPAHRFSERRVSGRGGIRMLLAIQKSYELLAKCGFFAREICDKCGTVLGAVRFTRRDESGVWCSRECRGDIQRETIRKGGRPRKYESPTERRTAKTRQQRGYRAISVWKKPLRIVSKTKDLQARKSGLSTTPPYLVVSGPRDEPNRENGSAKV
jgi:hypothetical protein